MPSLAAVSTIDFPYKVEQQMVKEGARNLFSPSFPQVERMMSVFDNTEIKTRNLCKPLDYYTTIHSFEDQNAEYIRISLEYSIQAIEECIASAQISKNEITDLIFISTTGLSTPSLDALIINKMRLPQNINRMAVFGLGCAGGVAGFSKANVLAIANPNAVVLLVMNDNGNMSSTTVLYVLERFFTKGFKNGYGLMASMGPGFSCEMVLLQMNKK